MKITIEPALNGYIVTQKYAKHEVEEHKIKKEKWIVKDIKTLLHHILDVFEPQSDHAEMSIYIIEAPGAERDEFTEDHHRIIWPKD